jgi:hypothetical protein
VGFETSSTIAKATKTKNPANVGFFDNAFSFYKDVPGDPHRDIPRTWDRLFDILTAVNTRGELPMLVQIDGCEQLVETAPKKYSFQSKPNKGA